jgi:SAM-dependent methyltransferase
VGAGFGRLSGEFGGYTQAVLLDYSFSQLQYAQEHYGMSPHFVYVAADAYRLPFKPGVFDAVTMIRVIHHMADVPAVLAGLRRALVPGGAFVLEHANKRNLKALLRYALKRQAWNPNDLAPVEFVALNFDFHPDYIQRELLSAGFAVERRLPVSYFRLPALKNRLPPNLLASVDGALQGSGLLYAPSVFVGARAVGEGIKQLEAEDIFACPECGGSLTREGEMLVCGRDGLRWAVRGGIYDFKVPV